MISPIFSRENAKSSAISVVKSTAFILVFLFAFSYAGTPKENGLDSPEEVLNIKQLLRALPVYTHLFNYLKRPYQYFQKEL